MEQTTSSVYPSPESLEPAARAALEKLGPAPMAIEQLALNAIKGLIVDAVEKANSGHPGGPLSSVDFVYVLFADFLKMSADPDWLDRDRFVLSGGHMSMLLYTFLHLTGRLPMDDLKRFRQLDSPTQGHPVYRLCPGVETSTGPLGQGFGNGVGMAMAEKLLTSVFGRELVDHHTYVVATDGDFQEGVCRESAAIAGVLGLEKLIVFYDSNRIQLASPTSKTMHEDVGAQFASMNWNVLDVPDGHDRAALRRALDAARRPCGKPVLVVGHTNIANDTRKEGTIDSHGMPLGADVIREFKERHGHPLDQTFWLPKFVYDVFRPRLAGGTVQQRQWSERVEMFRREQPDRARDWDLCFSPDGRKQLAERAEQAFATVEFTKPRLATRAASGQVMAALAKTVPCIVGGSADLANSTKTDAFEKVTGYFVDGLEAGTWKGRGIHYGVREHGMGSVSNGIALHGGLRPYTGTFLPFADYMRAAIRLAAISRIPVTFIFTHDSILLGEDGETHQPIEQLASLRAIPRTTVLRPADANECVMAWRFILSRPAEAGPVVLVLTRQDLPVLAETKGRQSGFDQGAYVVRGADVAKPDIQVLASGSEVSLALEAAKLLEAKEGKKTRVISVPSLETFLRQPASVRDRVLLPAVPLRLAVEAAIAQGWKPLTGDHGDEYCLSDFGESAPMEDLQKKYGFLPEPLAERMAKLIREYPARAKEYAARLGV